MSLPSLEPNIRNENSTRSQPLSLNTNDLLLILRKNWCFLIFFVLLGILGAFSYIRWVQPKYSASSILKLEIRKESGLLGMAMPNEEASDNFNDLSGEVEFIKSNLIYDDVIKKLNLKVSYHQEGKLKDEEKFNNSPFTISYNDKTTSEVLDKKIRIKFTSLKKFKYGLNDDIGGDDKEAYINQTIILNGFTFSITTNGEIRKDFLEVPFYVVLHSYSSLQNYFEKGLDVSILNINAKTIQVNFTDINASKAAEIVNAIDTVYLYQTIANKQIAQEQTLSFIHSQLDSAQNKLSSAETSIENFVRNVKTNDPSSEFATTITKIDELRNATKLIDKQLYYISDLKTQIDFEAPMENPLSVFSGIENAQLRSGILLLNEKFNQLEKLKLTYNESTMAYKKQKAESNNLKSGVKEIINQESLILNKEKSKLMQEMSNLQERFYSLPSKETELNRLKRFYNLYEKYYLTLQDKEVEYGIAKAGTVPHFVILAKAYVQNMPVSPIRNQVYAFGLFIGLFLSVVLIVIKLLLQNTILDEGELKYKLDVGFLGTVPRYLKSGSEYSKVIITDNPKSSISESFRSIRTNIEFMCPLTDHKVIGVTSTTSGEGKTFISVNLAAIIASIGKKVIIIDLDMRKPKIHHCFDVSNTIGMSNMLVGKATLSECIQKTQVENLSFITAGLIPPNPTELMLRPRFLEVIKELKDNFDIILIDTPPVGIVTDANIILKHTDMSIFVLRAEYTHKGAEEIVNNMNASKQFGSMGVVLNSVDQKMTYGKNFGYGYYDETQVNKWDLLSFFRKK